MEFAGYKDYLAGLLAGVATVVVGHPFDTVKVKLQKHNNSVHGIKYRSGLHCAARTLTTEGVKGLYRGATSSFVGMAFESSLIYGIYSQAKQRLQGSKPSVWPDPQVIVPSAALGGAVISAVLCPTELVKCRMQVQGTDALFPSTVRYKGPLDCVMRTVKNEGVSGIFRGGSATLLRESIGNAVFFCVYEYLRHYMHSQLKPSSLKDSNLFEMGVGVMTGGLGGIACWLAVLPMDVAKTIIQTSPDSASTRNPFLVLNSIYLRAGLRGCYRGLGPTVVRAFPANAVSIVTWELASKMLGVKRD